MAFSAKRAGLITEIAELNRLQMGAKLRAALGGWTRQAEAWHEMRGARIADLRRELEALEGTNWSGGGHGRGTT
jgi:hypothetical protein